MKRTATPTLRTSEESTPDVMLDAVYPQPPERIWSALTDAGQLAKWLMPNDFTPRLGHRFTFRDRRGPAIHCEVIALEEAHRLSYTWRRGTDESLSVVTWTLEPVTGGATRVRLTHTGLRACVGTPALWPSPLRRLSHLLNPVVRVPVLTVTPRRSLWRSHP